MRQSTKFCLPAEVARKEVLQGVWLIEQSQDIKGRFAIDPCDMAYS
jgi:hypothetical protein